MQKGYENDFPHPINTKREEFCSDLQDLVSEHEHKFDVPDSARWRVL